MISKYPKLRGTRCAAVQKNVGKAVTLSGRENQPPMKNSCIEDQEMTAVPTPIMGVSPNFTYTTAPFHSSTAAWLSPEHLVTPQSSQILPSTTISGSFAPSTPTALIYHPPYNHTHTCHLRTSLPKITYHSPTTYPLSIPHTPLQLMGELCLI